MKIEIQKHGPYKVIGKIPLKEKKLILEDGKPSVKPVKDFDIKPESYLCRCGHSKHAPYCDGTHKQGFDGTLTAPFGNFSNQSVDKPEIHVMQNEIKGVSGPLSVKGFIPISDGEKTFEQKESVSLCRCGASKKKPLCDGSHQAINYHDK